jgi:hypothetical protein
MSRGSARRVSALALASAIVVTALVSLPSAAKKCDAWVSGYDESYIVRSGQVVCADDGGVVIGGVEAGGTFIGGAGWDQVRGWVYGTFIMKGAGGSAWNLGPGGLVVGNERNNDVLGIAGGKFEGGPGDDIVLTIYGDGVFAGGAGNDEVLTMSAGSFLGASGTDKVFHLACPFDGKLRAIEDYTPCES